MAAATPAVAAVAKAGVAHQLHHYDHDPRVSAFGLEAAEALGVEPARVCKTLVASVDDRLVVGIVPVTAELDLRALAAAVGGKRAAMADPVVAARTTGYVLGGISPIGQKKRLPTVVDESAVQWPTVFVSGGRRGLEIELAPADLVQLTSGAVAPIARSWRGG
jgi:Cys-tRNA(Pro)/Cys-tRNA(Cys) deacylase